MSESTFNESPCELVVIADTVQYSLKSSPLQYPNASKISADLLNLLKFQLGTCANKV